MDKDENNANKNLPVVQNKSLLYRFKKKMQKYIYIGMSVLGIVLPYADQAVDIVNAKPPSTPTPVNEVINENMESKYEQALENIGVSIELKDDVEIPDDPPEERYDTEYKGEEPQTVAKGGDDTFDFYKSLTGYVEDDVALYRKHREKLLKTKDDKSKETKEDKKNTNEHDLI